jgi:hypothetical protein
MKYATKIDSVLSVAFDDDIDEFRIADKTTGYHLVLDISAARQLAEWISLMVHRFDDRHSRLLDLNKNL